MKLGNMKIGVRLGAGFGIVLLLMIALIGFGLARFDSINRISRKMIEQDWVKAEAVNTINATTRANARRTLEIFLAPDKVYAERTYQKIEDNKQIISDALKTLDGLIAEPEGKALLSELKEARARYVVSFGKVGKMMAEDKREEAAKLMTGETLPTLDVLQEIVKRLSALQKKGVEIGRAHV